MNMKTRLIAILLTAVMLFGLLPVVGYGDGAENKLYEFAGSGDMPQLPGGYGENNDQPPVGTGEEDEPTEPGTVKNEPTPSDGRTAVTMELEHILNGIADINETIYMTITIRKQNEDGHGHSFFWPDPLILHNGNEVGEALSMGGCFRCIVEASELGYGVHELVVSYPGNEEFAPCKLTVRVTVRQKLKPNVVNWYPNAAKTGEPFTFGGQLVDENGAPIAGSSLRIWVPIYIGYANGSYFKVVTDENGLFSCDVPRSINEEGTLEVIVRPDDDVNLLNVDNYRYIRFSNTVYTVNASALPAEAGVVSGAGTYASGDEVNLTAAANPGWIFKGWRFDGSNVTVQNNPYTATAKNMTATAVFEAIPAKHIELVSHPDFEPYTVYTGRELIVRGRLTDDAGNTAASVGKVRAGWDTPDTGEVLDVVHGEFTYTAVPTESGIRYLWFTYYDENDNIRFAVNVRFDVCENYITGVELNGENFKTEYQYGEELDLTGLFLLISRIDGSVESAPVTENMIFRFRPEYLGEQPLKIRYVDEDDFPRFFEITVRVTEEQRYFTVSFVTGDVCPAPAQRSTEWNDYFGNVLGEAAHVSPANTDEYEFLGWYSDEDCTENANYYTHVSGDVTLYALWNGPKALITEAEIVVSQPKAGDHVKFYSAYDENSDSLASCGVALGEDSVGKVKIVHAFWTPILENFDWNDPAWHTFIPGVAYELELALEPEDDGSIFKGHQSAYDEDYNFDPDKAFALTVNDLYDQNAISFVGSSYACVTLTFRVHPTVPGDVNKDGKVTIGDVTFLLNGLAGGAIDDLIADVDGSGALSIGDVTALLNILSQKQ